MGHHRTTFTNYNFVKPQILQILDLSLSRCFGESIFDDDDDDDDDNDDDDDDDDDELFLWYGRPTKGV